jgi:hypothetical protein
MKKIFIMSIKKIQLQLLGLLVSVSCFGQIPILNSNPSITDKVIYLDFDGQVVSGTAWNSGNTIYAAASTISNASKILVWKRVSEDYRPFDVNITTDSVRFNNATPNKRMRVVITPTSAWYGSAGGVTYLGSFTWGGTPGTPCWVFENQLGYASKSIAEATSHEVGHALSLYHQSTYNSSCTKTNEYNPGVGSGVTSWAPIMGVGYNKNVTIWHNGTNAQSCTTIQQDHGTGGITGISYLRFLPDDVGNTYNTAKILNLSSVNLADSGIITTPTDIDLYKFTICDNRYVSVAVKPWALDTTNYSGANLDVRFHLFDASNNLIAGDTNLNKLNTLVGANLTPGSYYFKIDGGGSNYYTDYGSIGKYYISIKATNPPALSNTIVPDPSICAGQNTILNYTSNGVPTNWTWIIDGASSNTLTVQNPTVVFSPAGVYTISLLATSSSSLSCPTTITLNIGSFPNVAIAASNTVLCPAKSITLTASGAQTYSWLPGGLSASVQVISPSQNSTYTVLGFNGTCTNSAVTSISVVPNFTVTATVSDPIICLGESLTITATGANNYTIQPGNITILPALVTPNNTTGYTISGGIGSCVKSVAKTVTVSPQVNVNIMASDTTICAGESSTLTAYGSVNYTFNPGVAGNQVVVSPLATTAYTVTTENNFQCQGEKTFTLTVEECTSLDELQNERNTVIYPNPANYKVSVISSQTGKLEIINAVGGKVYEQKIYSGQTNSIDIHSWPRGIYFILLNAEHKTVHKLIVE